MKKITYIIVICCMLLLNSCQNNKNSDVISDSDIGNKTTTDKSNEDKVLKQNLEVSISDIEALDSSILSDSNVQVINNPSTITPREISGDFSSHTITSPEDALCVLLSLRNIFGIKTDTFCLIEKDDARTKYVVYTLGQLHNGVLVDRGLFFVTADKNTGKPISVNGSYQDNITVKTDTYIDSKTALDAVNFEKKQKVKNTDLVIYSSDDNNYLLCWKYDIQSSDITKNKIAYVNAQTGEFVNEVYTTIS